LTLGFSFLIRKFTLLIGLMSLLSFVSSNKSIDCSFSKIEWYYFNRTFRTCIVYNQAIDNVGFTIASSADSSVEGFNIQNNTKIEFIPENLSEKFPNLINVQIFNCSLKSIDEHHFKGLRNLVTVYLAFNKIERIDSNAFKDNVKLEQLTLNNNNIKYLSEDLFNSLRNLKILHLNDNQIRLIDTFLFKHSTSMEYINMDNNEVRFLYPETFSTLSNLKKISIGDNQLESIDQNLLANNKKLEKIWFENNKLKSIDATMFDDKKSLLFVVLKGNSCINDTFFSQSFESMKTQIKEKCSPSIDSLKRELLTLMQAERMKYGKDVKEWNRHKAQLTKDKTEHDAEMKNCNRKLDEFNTKTADLTETLNSKNQELEQCGQEKNQEIGEAKKFSMSAKVS
jgi:chorismate mutase